MTAPRKNRYIDPIRQLVLWWLALNCTVFTVILLLIPGAPPPPGVTYANTLDATTLGHMIVFGLMFLLWYLVAREYTGHIGAVLLAYALILVIGTGGEFVQYYFVTGRGGSVFDWAANSFGAFAVWAALQAVLTLRWLLFGNAAPKKRDIRGSVR